MQMVGRGGLEPSVSATDLADAYHAGRTYHPVGCYGAFSHAA